PMIGSTVATGSPNVVIGGVPMPSLFSLALAKAFQGLFKVGGAVFRRLTAKAKIAKLLTPKPPALRAAIELMGPAHWRKMMMADLVKIASTRSGRQMLKRFAKTGKTMKMQQYLSGGLNASSATWESGL